MKKLIYMCSTMLLAALILDAQVEFPSGNSNVIILKKTITYPVHITNENQPNTVNDYVISDINSSAQSIIKFDTKGNILYTRHNTVDLMKDISGVYFNKAGILNYQAGSSAPSLLRIRGLGATPNAGILTVVDNVPQTIGIWRHPLWDTLTLNGVESVEVIKGPSGVEYGNQAVAGVINIKTKRNHLEGMQTLIGLSYGSYQSQDYFINNTFKQGLFDYHVSGTYKSTAGQKKNFDSYQKNINFGMGYELNPQWYFSVDGSYDSILFFSSGTNNQNLPRYSKGGGGETSHYNINLNLKHSHNNIEGQFIVYNDQGNNKFFKDSNNKYNNNGVKLIETATLFKGNVSKIGMEWQQFGGQWENEPAGGNKQVSAYENDYAIFTMLEQEIHPVDVNAGLRYAYNDKWKDELVPGLGAKLNTWAEQYLFVNIQKGYKTPEIGRRIAGPPKYEVTKPEEYWQYEIGLLQKIDWLFYKLSYYQIKGKNLIQVIAPPFPPTAKNTGKIFIKGIELDTYINPFNFARMGTFLSYMDPGDKTAYQSLFNGKVYTLFQIRHNVSAKIESEFSQKRYDADNKKNKLGDYMIFNSYISYTRMLKNIESEIYLEADNILNKKYLLITGYSVPGFEAKLGVLFKI